MKFDIDDALLEQLRDNEIATSVPNDVAEGQEIFQVYGGMGPCSYLTADGIVLIDGRGWDEAPVREATSEEATMSIVCGAKLTGIAGLLDLLPKPMSASAMCSVCNGTRYETISGAKSTSVSLVCSQCHGLGWCPN